MKAGSFLRPDYRRSAVVEIHSDRAASVDEQGRLVQPQMASPQMVPPQVAPPQVLVANDVVGRETVLTSHTSRFTPAAIVAAIVAIALLVVGGITLARAGLDGGLDKPVVTVANYTATALLGVIEVVFGLVLLIAALNQSRETILFLGIVGIVGFVASVIAAFQTSIGHGSLAIERGFAVIVAIAMAALVVAALLPTVQRRNTVRRTSDIT